MPDSLPTHWNDPWILKPLVGQIQHALSSAAATEEELLLISQSYFNACEQVRIRLRHCLLLLEKNETLHALQIAEIPAPPLLELLAILDFPQAEEWLLFCQREGYPCPLPFSPDQVSPIHHLYRLHPQYPESLFQDYFDTVLQNEPTHGWSLLSEIKEFCSSDPLPTLELQRSITLHLDNLHSDLKVAVQQQNSSVLQSHYKRLLPYASHFPQDHPSWNLLLSWRAQSLFDQLIQQKSTPSHLPLSETLPLYQEFQTLQAQLQQPLQSPQLEALQNYFEERRRSENESQQSHRIQKHIESYLQTPLPSKDLPSLRLSLENLRTFRQSISENPALLPLQNKLQIHEKNLLRRIQRTRLKQGFLLAFSSLGILAMLFLTIQHFHRKSRTQATFEQLQNLLQQNQFASAKAFFQIHSESSFPAHQTLEWQSAWSSLTGFLQKAESQISSFTNLISTLQGYEQSRFENTSPDHIQNLLLQAQSILNVLPSDLQDQYQAQLLTWMTHWESYLESLRQSRNQAFSQHLQKLQNRVNASDTPSGSSNTSTSTPLSPEEWDQLAQPLLELQTSSLPQLQIRPDLLLQWESLQNRNPDLSQSSTPLPPSPPLSPPEQPGSTPISSPQ